MIRCWLNLHDWKPVTIYLWWFRSCRQCSRCKRQQWLAPRNIWRAYR